VGSLEFGKVSEVNERFLRKDKTNLAVKGRYAQTLRGLIWGFNFFVGHGKDLPSPRLFELGVTFELV
jgi:hypothetical protein